MSKFLTNQNIELDLELASVGDRVVAFILDALIIFAYIILISFLASAVGAGSTTIFILAIPVFFYSLFFEVFSNGQSPGKRSRNIKVVKVSGVEPNIGNYLLRWMFRLIDIYSFYGAAGLISMAVSKNTQRLGDMVAGTTVIKVRDITSKQAFNLSTASDHDVTFSMAKLLSDEQIELMKKALRMAEDSGNQGGIQQLAIKLKEKLQIQTELSDQQFLKTVIKDYEHMAQQ